MVAYAETHRQASHVRCARCCAPQEGTAARLSAKAWLACLPEQEVHPCFTGITACGSSQTKQQVQFCRLLIALHTVCMSIKLQQQHLLQHVISLIIHGLIFSWLVGIDSHAALLSLREFTPHAAASAYMLTAEVQNCLWYVGCKSLQQYSLCHPIAIAH